MKPTTCALVAAWLSALHFFNLPAIQAEPEMPARFALGSVPDQTVWSGSTRAFLLYATNYPNAVLSLVASPAPQGTLSLEYFAGPDWVFRYAPSPQDKTPFQVTVNAVAGAETISQSWTMTPQPVLPPEADYFGTDAHTQPAIVSQAGLSVFDREETLEDTLNYTRQKLRNVRIVGETVELKAGHANGLYEAYGNGDRRDLRSVEIIADRVIIGSPVRLKQTQVTIWARELSFMGDGQIRTTPEEKLQSKGSDANGGLAGDNGLPAGDITLKVGAVVTETPGVKFDLTGGRGQPGGSGEHGANGSSISEYWPSIRVCDSGMCKTHTAPAGTYIVYYRYTFAGVTVQERGTKAWPEDGKAAKPSGKPGEGGRAGNLASSIDVAGLFSQRGGLSAAPTLPTSWPYDHYAGGAAGTPIKSQQVSFYVEWFQMKATVYNHESKEGTDAEVRRAATTAGAAGAYTLTSAPTAWVHPLALRKVLHRIRDYYLANQISQADVLLEEYLPILSALKAAPTWGTLDTATQLDLSQIHDEMTLLRQSLEAGLDYFGNPAAWVPMLSFEVNTTLFNNEIDRAINALYLAYWLKHKQQTEQQRLNALTTLRDQLRTELGQARTDYDRAVTRLPVLRAKAQQLDSDIRTVQLQLQAKETELLNDTREPDWVFGLRFGLKLSAMMCQMIPVYQPALGAVGEGLRVASDFNPERPWDSITDVGNVGASYLDSGFEASAQDQQTAKNSVDLNQVEQKSFDYAGALSTAGAGLSQGMEDIRGFLKEREAPSAEMLAELERLKSLSPEYQALMEKVEAMLERNRQFAEEITSTMQQIAALSDLMRRNILTMDALNRQIAPATLVMDERATVYLDDLERRAYDRLLKYHYYMAKAYEYRLLKPYTQSLDLEGLIRKFQEIAAPTNSHQLTPEQFGTLKAVYQDKLSTVAETIFDHYNVNRPDLSVPVRFNLTDAQLAALNADQTIALDLRDLGFFQPNEENIRIVDFKLVSMTTEAEGGSYGSTAFVDLRLEHSGISTLKLHGASHRFRHYNRLTENPIVWGGRYDAVDHRIDPIQPSEASNSLLRSLLSGEAVSDMLLYSRPSAWADLRISRATFNSNGRPINLKFVRLELVYDFTPRSQTLGQRDLEVWVTTALPDGAGGTRLADASLLPYFELGQTDVNGRRDARGRFLRVFGAGVNHVSITAPTEYGQWQFAKWTDRFGQDLPGGPFTSPALTLPLPTDRAIAAQYVAKSPEVLSFQPPTLSRGLLMLDWNGGPGVRLQTIPALGSGSWQDVPGTAGQSHWEAPVSGNRAFFRIVR